MKWRPGTQDIIFISVVSCSLVLALLFGLNILPPRARNSSQAFSQQSIPPASTNPIVQENTLIGTSSWKIPPGKEATTQIQAYASATSILPGHTLTFYVSTQNVGTPYSISIYRLGWYNGQGGRMEFFLPHQVGQAQGYYDTTSQQLIQCSSCQVDLQTGLVEANWQPSYQLLIPFNWVTGVYLAKFTDINDMQTYVPFDVRGSASSPYVVATPNTTDAAYNFWGGSSLYVTYFPKSTSTGTLGRGVKVSFNRPYVQGFGSAQLLYDEVDAIHYMERQGYDLSYISDIDVHEDSTLLLHHKAYLTIGHDEYWSKEMRDNVEQARDKGIGLAFIGGNDVYWQIRLEASNTGQQDRTVVCYKVDTHLQDWARDPFYGKDNTRVTSLWRDPVLSRPENELMGIMYSYLNQHQRFPWQLSKDSTSPLLKGTGLEAGQSYGCDIVGNEWDRVTNNGATPANIQIIGASPTINSNNQADISNTTYYIASSGAMVFAAGAIYWSQALDDYRFSVDKACGTQNLAVPGLQKLFSNVMDSLIVSHSPDDKPVAIQ